MNKKVMAIAMAAVMLMVVVTVGVSAQNDADVTPVDCGNRYILGSESEAYVIYFDRQTEVNATIEFNEAAFSKNKEVSFTVNGNSATLGTEVDLTTVKVTITKLGDSGNKDGKYNVKFKGVSDVNDFLIPIVLLVEDKVKYDDNTTVQLPPQKYTFNAKVSVVTNGGDIKLEGTGVETKVDGSYPLTFNFSTTYDITASVFNSTTGETNGGYKFYATGLPSGLSMTTDGHIGGKLSSGLSKNDTGSCVVYAVSESGLVQFVNCTWTLGDKNDRNTGSITIIGNEINLVSTPYIALKNNESISLEVGASNGYSIKTGSVSVLDYEGEPVIMSSSDGKYTGNVAAPIGTGTYKLSITATLTKTGEFDKTVTEYVTVYVVGGIVDADLKPTVSSRTV